jgi:Rps23 Pro-64 3,4-dihydroxylase Tpa1-like proline 4-hydroxylase
MTKSFVHPRIFVQIASYRDPDCQWTVKDLFEKATHPERVFVGICWQFVKGEDDICFQVPYPRSEQVRVHEVDAKQSKGVCWARGLVQKLWKDEEFTLQIDSHMRFEPGWDESLIEMWKECGKEKAVITCYPPGFAPPNKLQRKWIFGMSAKEFDQNGILLMHGKPAYTRDQLPQKPIHGAFASACMYFGPSRIIKDVPYDPNLYFFGEEISLAVRFWTHGYDLFHPNRPVIYHDWDRSKRPTHFSDHNAWQKQNERSFVRVRHMLGTVVSDDPDITKDLDIYGLGKERTLAEYQAFSGVNFAARTLTPLALSGEYDPQAKPQPTPRQQIIRQGMRKVFESDQAIVFDDFLPEDIYQRVYDYALKTDYEYINTKGKIARAWHLQDGFPLRSLMNLFYYAPGVKKPEAHYVYPTKTDLDLFMDYILSAQTQVQHMVGQEGKDWEHVTSTCWLYPHGTGLAMHDDGSGIYSGAYVYFLNPTWRTHWGGMLIMMDEECNRRVHEFREANNQMDFYQRKWLHGNGLDELLMEHAMGKCILPKRNRMVFIANHAYHMVTRVNEAAGDNIRMSVAGFFNRKKSTGNTGHGNY